MYVIRPAEPKDLEDILRFSLAAGIGMTHLPGRKDVLEKLINKSADSFKESSPKIKDEEYMFVLEDLSNHKVGGTCAIHATTGSRPFYIYRLEKLLPKSKDLAKPKENRVLRLTYYVKGPTEICGLYLQPEYRKEGLGKFLSHSRFFFIANHPERFAKNVIANMRGVIHENSAPFWEAIGRHFLDTDLEKMMKMRIDNEHLVEEIFPPYPICVAILPKEAQEVIGKVHEDTIPALAILEKEGFKFADEIDPVDGGPIVTCSTKELLTAKQSNVCIVSEIISNALEAPPYLISNTKLAFRACLGTLQMIDEKQVALPAEIAEGLQVQKGDQIRYLKL